MKVASKSKEEEEENELTQEEKELLVEIFQNHIKKLYQEIRQNDLTINNDPLKNQYSENYIVMLRGQNLDYKDRIRRIKLVVNKIFGEEMYKKDEL